MTDRHIRLENGFTVRRPIRQAYRPNRVMLALAVIAEVIGALVVFLTLFVGIPLLLFLVAGGAS
jgi:hypothetical protein